MSTNAPLGVLDGYKVLDFTQYVAGPTVTLMMAEMGAEVIKVELAPGGDKTRVAPMQVEWPQRLLRPAQSRQEKPLPRRQDARRAGNP